MDDEEFGYKEDSRKILFETVPGITLEDVKQFQVKYVKDKPFVYCILGNTKDVDLNYLKSLGNVTILSQEEIFGY